uniref:Uncharacterized protein n=1 Tax=Clandestinovirus TaxID=2831644 RepID=A0A8F8KTL6_9VIRU|nr:hypothetical protein KOM_12_169 [Clandestinovirus]
MSRLPQELMRIIKDKKKKEEEEMTLKVFEDFIIPYLYHININLYMPLDTFTSVQTVCKRLAIEVSYGMETHVRIGMRFFSSSYYFCRGPGKKKNPFPYKPEWKRRLPE